MLTVAVEQTIPKLSGMKPSFYYAYGPYGPGIQIDHIGMTGFCPTVPGASAGKTQKLRVTGWLRSPGHVFLLAIEAGCLLGLQLGLMA